jgi:prophage regulatory protein
MQQSIQDRIIRERECKNRTGLSRATRWRLEREARFPKRRQLSAGAVGWLESEISAWVDARASA